jgi:hypothetical protein
VNFGGLAAVSMRDWKTGAEANVTTCIRGRRYRIATERDFVHLVPERDVAVHSNQRIAPCAVVTVADGRQGPGGAEDLSEAPILLAC